MTRTRLRIERAIASVEPAHAHATETRLRELHEACGCREGAVLMLVGTCTAALDLALHAAPRPPLTIVLILVGVLFASAAVGKAIGVVTAKLRLQRLLRRIETSAQRSISKAVAPHAISRRGKETSSGTSLDASARGQLDSSGAADGWLPASPRRHPRPRT